MSSPRAEDWGEETLRNEKRGVRFRLLGNYLGELAIALIAYCIAGRLGQATTAIRSNNLGPVWPAYGVALGVFLVYGYRIWPALITGAFLVALLSPVSAVAALGQAVGATSGALTGAFLLNRLGFDRTMARLRDAVWLVMLGAFGSALISASLGTLALYGGHVTLYSGLASGWLVYWLGDSTGVLLVTPLVLTMPDFFRIRDGRELLEFALLMVLLTTSSFIVFAGSFFISVSLNFLAFGVLPFVMWSAIRLGTAVTSLSVLIVATIATVETALGSGPFAGNTPFINAVLLDIFFAVVAITGLTLAGAIAERKEAERDRERMVREQSAREARIRLASIIESSDDAIIGAQLNGTITDWNKGAELLFGYALSEVIGKSLLLLLADTAQKELRDLFYDLKFISSMNRYDSVCKKKDGTHFEAAVRVSSIFDASGRICGGSVSVRDITFRKRQEAILRESEARFRLVADTAPVLIWMSGTDKLCTYFNQTWLEFTGRTLESQLGHGWAEKVHPDDLNRCMATYARCFDRRESFRMEYRLQRYDGEYRWILDCGVPRFNLDGSFAGYIGSCTDVTENKLAEEAIATVNGRLIDAQEKERTRIARELHDDINQRLALLAVEIEQSTFGRSNSAVNVQRGNLSKRISEISDDVQAISHALHSFKLEHLGLLAAMRSFCVEFAQQQELRVEFVHDEGPYIVSSETSLTLFRILQEALHNASKHSQSRHFKVELRCNPGEIFLQVSDWGVGFETDSRTSQSGLGLVSMRERVRLVKGTFEIDSKPMAGTVVRIRVPTGVSKSRDNAEQGDDSSVAPTARRKAS